MDSMACVLLLGLCAVPLCLNTLRIFAQHRILGVLMIILSKMMYDVSLFLVIFSTIVILFTLPCVVGRRHRRR